MDNSTSGSIIHHPSKTRSDSAGNKEFKKLWRHADLAKISVSNFCQRGNGWTGQISDKYDYPTTNL